MSVADMVDRIAFSLNISIGDPWMDSESFKPSPGAAAGELMTLGQSIGFSMTGVIMTRPNEAEQRQLEQSLQVERQTLSGGSLMGVFRSALKNRNPIDRFLCLYNILLLKHGDNQGAVDGFIRTEEPAVAQKQSPRFPKVMETAYTRLRNEFAHIRAGMSFDQTRQEMAQHLAGLKTLKHKACLIP